MLESHFGSVLSYFVLFSSMFLVRSEILFLHLLLGVLALQPCGFYRVKREAALRLTIQSLLAFVKCHWKEAAKKAERMSGLVARSVRRLMMRDLPTNVMIDCGVIVVEIDLRRNRLTSSLWVSEFSK